MNYAVITTKVDPEVKKEAAKLAHELGVSLSGVVKVLLKQFIRTRQLSVRADEIPSKYLRSVMKQAEENYKKGNHSPLFRTGDEAVEWLEKQGV